VLLIEEDPVIVKLIEGLLEQADHCSLAQGLSFQLTSVESLSDAKEQLTREEFQVILLNLMGTDSQGVEALVKLRDEAPRIPIIVYTNSEDETLVVKSFQFGADGYLCTNNLDTNLLLYEIRLATERQRYIAQLELLQQKKNQEREFEDLELLATNKTTIVTARMFGSEPLRESVPDIFEELVQVYAKLLDLALEQRAYRVEHNISEQLRSLADKLGFLKASPRDVVEIHTKTLREKNQDVTLAKAQAHVTEGRLMVLELMGYLTSFYRKYYIGLSNINLFPRSERNRT
jgi:DNA-binding NarL/FixJ family response regulator